MTLNRAPRSADLFPLSSEGDWLLTDEVESWSGSHAQRAWRYLQLSLERHDDAKANYPYRKAVLEAVLEMDRLDTVPSWLVKFFEVSHRPLAHVLSDPSADRSSNRIISFERGSKWGTSTRRWSTR